MEQVGAADSISVQTRMAKSFMVAALGAFGLLVGLNNITDYGSNFTFVRHVLSMDTTFSDNHLLWRAVHVPVLWHLFYAVIITGELAVGVLFCLAALSMWQQRHASFGAFRVARRLVPLATALGFAIWFFGFSVVGAEWFLMWQSHDWNGQEPAFRFFVTMIAVCIFVQQPE